MEGNMSLTYSVYVNNFLVIEEGKETSLKESRSIDVGYTAGSICIAGKRVLTQRWKCIKIFHIIKPALMQL
eukprot:15306479-Ditylum_brightwellii.AAC.1